MPSGVGVGNLTIKAMENQIEIFKHPKFGEIRCMKDERGDPWFVGRDVAVMLNYTNPSKAVRDHVDFEDKLSERIVLSGQHREAVFINESGLYSLILSSNMPQAKEFKHWVTSVVLPQIRKTGGYIPTSPNPSQGGEPNNAEILRRALVIYEKTVSLKDDIIEGLMPKVEYYDKVLNSPSTYTMTELAKELSMTVHELQEWLVGLHVIYRAPSGVFMLYAEYLKNGYEAYRTYGNKDLFGNVESTRTYLVWTEKGKKFVHDLLS